MPPEPFPWDRKDFFKEKKHERPESLVTFSKWRGYHQGSREFARWGSEEFRRPAGHGKQGGYEQLSEESGHGCTQRMLEDESWRPFTSRYDGKYNRSNRESKGVFSQKEWKGHLWQTGDASTTNCSGRQHDMSSHRSVDEPLSYKSHLHSDIENSWEQHQLKDQNENKMASVDGLGVGHRYGREHSLGPMAWKPLKWTRSSSLSSRGSSFSHSTCSKGTRVESDEINPDLKSGKVTPIRSPSGDAVAALTSDTTLEETCPRKKQRLGWGEGLAKYEKKKVEGPDDTATKNGLLPCSNNLKSSSILQPTVDKSPRITGLSECSSPATPSSVACSSSPGVDDKPCVKGATIDNDASNLSGSPGHGFLDGFSVNAEHLELNSFTNLSSLLIEWVQSDDASSGDSSFVKSTGMSKLLLLKNDILKEVEKTECEIDLFENQLKSLKSESINPCPDSFDNLQMECRSRSCDEVVTFNLFTRPTPLQVVSCNEAPLEKPLLCNGTLKEVQGDIKQEDIYSPGTATSKLVESPLSEKAVFPSDMLKHDEFHEDLDVVSQGKCIVPLNQEQKENAPCFGDQNKLINCGSDVHVLKDVSLHTDRESMLYDLILASNKESAREASEVLNKLLPNKQCQVNSWTASSLSCGKNDLLVKEKLALRKCSLRFKERVLTLKFRAMRQMWKEDMRLISIRKHRVKPQKRFDLGLRTSHPGYHKHRSSVRSRFANLAGSMTLVPTTEIVDFTSRLLLDSQIKVYRNSLRMPALILDENEKRLSRFVTNNGLIEDPCAVEKERAMINPWTSKEKESFLELLSTFGKDFRKIASFLDHKTTADCVEFYYKNQKSECFEKIMKSELKKRGRNFPTNTYMVTSGKKRSREINAASLDVLGAASVIAADAIDSVTPRAWSGKPSLGGFYAHKTSDGCNSVLERSSSFDALGDERDAAAADVLAGICGALSSEAMSSCITSSVDPGEAWQEWKCQKVNSLTGRPSTPEVTQNVEEEETCSDESCGELDSIDWTDKEKSSFIQALRLFGKDFAKISRFVRTRTWDQCKVFFSKARKCLCLDAIHFTPGNEGTPVSDANGGRSDTEDTGVMETESAICSTQSCSKIDEDLPSSLVNMNVEASDRKGATNLQRVLDGSGPNIGVGQSDSEYNEMKVKTVVSDDCQAVMKEKLIPDTERNFGNGVNGKIILAAEQLCEDAGISSNIPVQPHGCAVLSADIVAGRDLVTGQSVACTKESVSVSGQGLLADSESRLIVDEVKAVPDTSAEERGSGSELLVLQNGLDGKIAKTGSDSNGMSGSCCLLPDSNVSKNASNIAAETSVHPGFCLTSSYEHQISVDMHPIQKTQTIPWQWKENHLHVTAGSVLEDPSVIQSEENGRRTPVHTTLNFEEHQGEQHQKSSDKAAYHRYLFGHQSNHAESAQILRGYPLQVLNAKKMIGDADSNSGNSPVVQSFPKTNRSSLPDQYFVQDVYHDKCNGLKLTHSPAELSLLSRRQEQSSSDHPRPHSQSISDTEERSRRTGDVKLFGQILSHPSTLQKPNPSSNENVDKGSCSKSNSKSYNLKFTDNRMDGSLVQTKQDPNNYSGLEDFPVRSYGYWDGNRIQTGLSSLPDSAILLAKYPAAFGDYPTSSCRTERQPLPTVKRNDQNLGGISVFPSKDLTKSSGLTDCKVYSNYEDPRVQPFTVDIKRNGTFPELQKQNGFETISGFQQPGRAVVGMNVVGHGAIVGGCNGVSDPVAAIKMHYASTERFVGQVGSIRGEGLRSSKGDRSR